MQTLPIRRSYPSDLTDAKWRTIESLIPPERDRGRHRTTEVREVINGINYRWSTGCVWRMLPHDFPPWGTIYTYFRQWQRDGTLPQLRSVMLARSRQQKDLAKQRESTGKGDPQSNGDGLPEPAVETSSRQQPPAPAEAATDVELAEPGVAGSPQPKVFPFIDDEICTGKQNLSCE